MKANYLEVITKRLKSNDIYFIDKHGDALGSINVVDENIIYNNAISGTEHILNKPQGIGASGVNHGEYLYWDTNVSPPSWKVASEQIHLGTNAGKYNQGENCVAIGAYAGYTGQANNSIVINASGENLPAPKENALYISSVAQEPKIGVTGNFNTGVSSTQSANVMSYNPATKEITYRNLGLYNDISNSKDVLLSSKSILPDITGTTGANGSGYSLGSEEAYWKSIYVKEIFSSNSINIGNPDSNNSVIITTAPSGGLTLNQTGPNLSQTTQIVTTSGTTSGQIDANLLPFSGLSYIGDFNPKTYLSVSDNFVHQLNNMVYNLTYDITTSTLASFFPPNTKTNEIFQKINGSYYLIKGLGNDETITMNFPKTRYTTNLTTLDKTTSGSITSKSNQMESQNFTLRNNDILLISVTLTSINNVINLVFQFSVILFKVPINGINTLNIVDSAVTNAKLANNSVTMTKLSTELQNLIVSGGNANEFSQALFDSLNSELTISNKKISSLSQEIEQLKQINQFWRSKFNAIEEHIKIMLKTYTIKNDNDELFDYTGSNQSYVITKPKIYYSGNFSFKINVAIEPIIPVSVDGPVNSYTLESLTVLPTGLSFDVNTGIISGTPTEIISLNTYNVIATNDEGSSTTSFNIEVIL